MMFRFRVGSERRHDYSGDIAFDQRVGDIPSRRNGVVTGQWLPGTGHVGSFNTESRSHIRIGEIDDIFTVDVVLDKRQRVHSVREALSHFRDHTINR